MAGDEFDRHLDQGDPGLVGQRAERVGGVELCGVRGVRGVVGAGEALRAGGGAWSGDVLPLAVFAGEPSATARRSSRPRGPRSLIRTPMSRWPRSRAARRWAWR